MKTFVAFVALFFVFLLSPVNASAQPLKGSTGNSAEWGSGWIDLRSVTDFKKGDTLVITVGGTAKRILVRLLSRGVDPNSASGIDGGARDIPKTRLLKVVLESDHEQVRQISVHGGPNPWNIVSLGEDNGPATIVSIERRSHQTQKSNK